VSTATMHSGPAQAGHELDIAVKCCICHRVQIEKRWLTELPGRSRDRIYSHGYCPSCYQEAIEELSLCPMAWP